MTTTQALYMRALKRTPIFETFRNQALAEATEKAQQILSEGYCQVDFRDNSIWNVAPTVFHVRSHKGKRQTTLSCNCETYRLFRFC